MKFFQIKSLMAIVLLSVVSASSFAGFLGTAQGSKQIFKTSGKIVKEVFANRNMTLLNNANPFDRSFRLRTTADGVFLGSYGDNEKNPFVDAKLALRFRYDAGAPALISTTTSSLTLADAAVELPAANIQKSLLWLRELFMKISLDRNEDASTHFVKFGSFPYELGRGIALGAAYNSGGFLGLDPRFAIDQFAPGGLLHTDIFDGSLSGELYFSILNNPNSSYKENIEVIRLNEITEISSNNYRGLNRQSWFFSGALKWKALNFKDTKLTVDPYVYGYVSPDQKLDFPADSNSQLYAIGTAVEFKHNKFEWGFEGAFQGGTTLVKAWDRNYQTIKNDDGTVTVVYTKVYSDADLKIPAVVTTANKEAVASGPKGYQQNGKQIGSSSLYNGIDRFRPQQNIFYHGFFWVTDMSYKLIDDQLMLCADVGYTSGHLDAFNNVNEMTQADLNKQDFNGFIPVQSIYSGKRIQHLVMLNTGVPRFTVENPYISAKDQNVQSRVMGTKTLTDKFTNLAYTAFAIECSPAQFKDQNGLIKPVAIYYWMPEAPMLEDGTTVASHALGAALSIEFKATIKECLEMGGYVGWMIPGPQYKQFAGLKLKDGVLGSDVAYVLNFTMTYKF